MAILYGLKRIYKLAKNIDDLLTHAASSKEDTDRVHKLLLDHTQMEETRDAIRDKQLIEMTSNLNEITREVRPNGGSSMKDQINKLVDEQAHMKERMAFIEQWKTDHS
jgi:hypothetical protein